jgi:hypothetical protein
LLETKHEVAGLKRPSAYPSAVVVAEALLVDCSSSEGDITSFVQYVEGIFQCRLSVFFDVSYHIRCAVTHIYGKYYFCPKEQEE